MSKGGRLQTCNPYGNSVTCICDILGRIVRCFFPGSGPHGAGGDHSDNGGIVGEAMLRDPSGVLDDGLSDDDLSYDGSMTSVGGGGAGGRGLDERTEIILAATFLVLIILAFIR